MDSSALGPGESSDLPDAPPAAPRALTALARRRAWTDPRVRAWWILALALIAIAGYLLLTRYLHWRGDSWLVTAGLRLDAQIIQVNGMEVPGKSGPGDSPVWLRYEYNGTKHEVYSAGLEGRRGDEGLIIGRTVPIRIDPGDPSRWTPRTVPAPLAGEMVGGLIALPIGLLLLLVSLLMRSRRVRIWREGIATPAVVLTARHTATVPRGFAVQCTLADESDKRIFDVFAPAGADVREGMPIWLLFPPGGGRPVAASWFA